VVAVQGSAECGGGPADDHPDRRAGVDEAGPQIAGEAVGVIGLAQPACELVQPERGVCHIESVDTDLVRAAHDWLIGSLLREALILAQLAVC
jgi:hypothetical protein